MEQANIRKVFTPRRGFLFVRSDYSQLEVRLVAHCADEDLLIEALNSGDDIHARVAKEIFDLKCSVAEVKKLHKNKRAAAKAIVFGLNYGITAIGLAKRLRITEVEAQSYINAFFAKYKKLKKFMDLCESLIIHNLFIPTILCRKRRFQYANQRSIRQGKNFPIQATAAEVVKAAMVNVYSRIKNRHNDMRMLMQVHDELVVEVKIHLVDEAVNLVKETMEIGLKQFGVEFKVPMVVDPDIDYAWGFSMKEAKEEESEYLLELRKAFDSNDGSIINSSCKKYYDTYFRELIISDTPKQIETLPGNKIILVDNNQPVADNTFRLYEYNHMIELFKSDPHYTNYLARWPLS